MSATGCICAKRVQRWTDDAHCLTCHRDLTESQIQDVARNILCAGDTGIVLWRNNIGVARYTDDDGKVTSIVRYGVYGPGGADLIGVAPGGRFLAVETKARIGRQSAVQQEFQRLVESRGGIYAIVRSEAHARTLLARLRA